MAGSRISVIVQKDIFDRHCNGILNIAVTSVSGSKSYCLHRGWFRMDVHPANLRRNEMFRKGQMTTASTRTAIAHKTGSSQRPGPSQPIGASSDGLTTPRRAAACFPGTRLKSLSGVQGRSNSCSTLQSSTRWLSELSRTNATGKVECHERGRQSPNLLLTTARLLETLAKLCYIYTSQDTI